MFAKYAEVSGHAIHYLHTGPSTLPDVVPTLDRGALLVLLHGAGGTAGLWRPQLEHLEDRHSAVALDFPGHGRSSGVEGLGDIDAYAECLAVFARHVDLRPFVAVGRSLGGAVALMLALRHPELVRGLVLTGVAARFDVTADALEGLRAVVAGRRPQQFSTDAFSPATGTEVMRQVWTEQVKTDPRVTYQDLLACRAFEVGARLADIAVPALVVAGADDRLVPPAASEALARGIPGAEFAVLAGAGHVVPVERPEEFNRLVDDFVERVS